MLTITIDERNQIKDRERIKLFIERAMRELCDDFSDGIVENHEIANVLINEMVNLSVVYKNMGFDKAGGEND